eukprot:343999-Alexandrium_andersonii.AAC.1
MSASLVGSEMCIRDRDRTPKSAQTQPPEPSRGPFCAVFRAEREYGTVSYTHLTLPTICSV